ncbi:hypothetical protein AGABI2DRAFT_194628 [Agaricus bisporus var. bisporus H97]|uniref:hypothetical protein n=1 Tax=Agaricus bisporus var. bisporus (strain H97 / ATCC MYA-4626 / FGSC 10389) TaxID=936046 RepID=UPI00029F7EF3|nr:hypothetical protein AGABI2DRAFT_194628 [Agaricus bisporus var. bisporus H97]EKV44698.1 hypothetical protein AGABI2DRAFT_194628 [Agaricus bisporus var. bisporus H97]
MHLFHPSYLAAIVLACAGLVSAHNGTVWVINQNQSAYESQESFVSHQDASPVLMSVSAPSTLYSQWYATLLHPPGEETRMPINCTFRNEGSDKFAQSNMEGEVVTAVGEYIWILDPLPVTGWNIKCPQTKLVWTNVVVRYGENAIVLRENDNSTAQSFNFRTKSGLIE